METKQKKLLLRCADDSVIVMSFVLDDGHFVKREGTKEEIDVEIKKASEAFPQDRMPIISWKEIEDTDMPDRTFRNAWVNKGGKKIDHDLPKAKEIYKDNLRAYRQCFLLQLDDEYQRADETKDEIKRQTIIDTKQKLRDITKHPAIEEAKTVEDLKNLGMKPIIRIVKESPIQSLKSNGINIKGINPADLE